jgi:hypothetical protein
MAQGILQTNSPLKIGSFSADPSNPSNGMIYYNTTSNKFRKYINGAWTDDVSASDLTAYIKADGSVNFTGDQSLGGHHITNMSDPVNPQDGATKAYVDANSGANSANKTLSNLNSPTAINQNLLPDSDFTRNIGSLSEGFDQVFASTFSGTTANPDVIITDGTSTAGVSTSSGVLSLNSSSGSILAQNAINMQSHKVTSVTDPTSAQDAATKNYVDTQNGNFINKNGSVAFTGDQSMGTHKLTNLSDPTSAQDAATKNYVDTIAQGIAWKAPVRAVSTSNITLSGAQTVDGVSLIAGDRALVAGQTTAANNGIYVVASGAWTRSTDADTGAELVAAAVFVDEGTVNASTAWVQTAAAPITIGSTSLSFTKFASTNPYNFRNGLAQTGQNVDVVAGDASLSSTPGSLLVQKDAAGAIGLSGSGLKVNVDNSTIDISSNNIEVKAGGITNTQVASAAGIALTKLATLTNHNRALASDASGFITESAVTSTELGYLSGVTSAIQTQINAKANSASPVFTGTESLQDSGQSLERQYFDTVTITASQTNANITTLQVTAANYSGMTLDYVFKQSTSNFVRKGTLEVAYDGTNAQLVDTFFETGATGLSFDTQISTGNWQIIYTSGANGGNMRVEAKRFRA